MGLMTRVKCLIFFSAYFISCSSQVKEICIPIEIEECYFKEVTTLGTVKLFTPFRCEKAERLNMLILGESSWILIDLNINNKDLYFQRHKLSDIFTLDSVNYQENIDENYGVFSSRLETNVFIIGDKFLTYRIIRHEIGDKASPYYEHINIDIEHSVLFNLNQFIDLTKKEEFLKFINSYAIEHKSEVHEVYKNILSEKADQLLSPYQEVFTDDAYSLSKLTLKVIGAEDFSHFTNDGVVFSVSVMDENFELPKYQNRIGEHSSYVTIPYQEIKFYVNNKDALNSLKYQ